MVGPAVEYSLAKNEPQSSPPTLGQHTHEILRDLLHLPKSEIDELYSQSIVQ